MCSSYLKKLAANVVWLFGHIVLQQHSHAAMLQLHHRHACQHCHSICSCCEHASCCISPALCLHAPGYLTLLHQAGDPCSVTFAQGLPC